MKIIPKKSFKVYSQLPIDKVEQGIQEYFGRRKKIYTASFDQDKITDRQRSFLVVNPVFSWVGWQPNYRGWLEMENEKSVIVLISCELSRYYKWLLTIWLFGATIIEIFLFFSLIIGFVDRYFELGDWILFLGMPGAYWAVNKIFYTNCKRTEAELNEVLSEI